MEKCSQCGKSEETESCDKCGRDFCPKCLIYYEDQELAFCQPCDEE